MLLDVAGSGSRPSRTRLDYSKKRDFNILTKENIGFVLNYLFKINVSEGGVNNPYVGAETVGHHLASVGTLVSFSDYKKAIDILNSKLNDVSAAAKKKTALEREIKKKAVEDRKQPS
jgi:hypothetical protein